MAVDLGQLNHEFSGVWQISEIYRRGRREALAIVTQF
jgi:hypothetical protein